MKTTRVKPSRNQRFRFATDYSRPFEQFLGRTLSHYEREFICALEKNRHTGQLVSAEIFNNPDFDYRPILDDYRKFLDQEHLESIISKYVKEEKADEAISNENTDQSSALRPYHSCCAYNCRSSNNISSRPLLKMLNDRLNLAIDDRNPLSLSPPDPPPKYNQNSLLCHSPDCARAPDSRSLSQC